MGRIAAMAVGIGLVVAVVVAVALDGPTAERQEMAMPRGDEALEIELDHDLIDDGVITRAWAVDPYHLFGTALDTDPQLRETTLHLGTGGYDAVVLYDVFPMCRFAPDVRVRTWNDRIKVDLASHGGCDAESMRFLRAVALELADHVDATMLVASHEDPS